ncbi:MAG: nucleotidyl transferase AbiEii/AbiGii toxin family protein [archaeon]
MDEIKRINYDRILEIISDKGFDSDHLTKDYYLTVILYLIKDIEGLYFKGGTALQKIFLNYSRLSEDLDFTLTRDVKEIIKEIEERIKSNLFTRITKDKDVEGFTRLVVYYRDFSDKESFVFIDLNKRAKLSTKPEKYAIKHFYKDNIPEFSVNTLSKEEMIAEKMAAAIARNRPRDHYDLYKIIKSGIKININLVKEKCKQSNIEFNIIKMFNKANILKNRWDKDLVPLISENISFQTVMKTLSHYFKLKEEKNKLKNNKGNFKV